MLLAGRPALVSCLAAATCSIERKEDMLCAVEHDRQSAGLLARLQDAAANLQEQCTAHLPLG